MAFQVVVVVVTTLPLNAQASVWMPVVGAAVRVEPVHKVPVMFGVAGSGFTVTLIPVEEAEEQPLGVVATV